MCTWNEICNRFDDDEFWNELSEYFTRQRRREQKRDHYRNFTFRHSSCPGKYRLRLKKDGNSHGLDIYFEREGQNEDVRDRIINNLEQLIKQNHWDFSLGDWETKNRTAKFFEPDDANNFGNPEWIKRTMLLIAENLAIIEG